MQNYLKYTGWLKKVSRCTVITAYFFEPLCTNKTSGTFFPGNVMCDFWAQKFCKVV